MRLSTDTMMARLRQPRDRDTLGGRLWRAREAVDLSARDLADRLGVLPETVAAWERDRIEPRTNRLFMLAGVLGVAPAWLIAGIGTPPGENFDERPQMALREHLEAVRTLHAETGKAIAALEAEIGRLTGSLQ